MDYFQNRDKKNQILSSRQIHKLTDFVQTTKKKQPTENTPNRTTIALAWFHFIKMNTSTN